MGFESDPVAVWTSREVGNWLDSIGCGSLANAALQNNGTQKTTSFHIIPGTITSCL